LENLSLQWQRTCLSTSMRNHITINNSKHNRRYIIHQDTLGMIRSGPNRDNTPVFLHQHIQIQGSRVNIRTWSSLLKFSPDKMCLVHFNLYVLKEVAFSWIYQQAVSPCWPKYASVQVNACGSTMSHILEMILQWHYQIVIM